MRRTHLASLSVLVLAVVVFSGLLSSAQDAPALAPGDLLVLGPVAVTNDETGTGLYVSPQFDAPEGGGETENENLVFQLIIENGFRPQAPGPVDTTVVTLNGAIAFADLGPQPVARVPVALEPTGNVLEVTTSGPDLTGVRVAVVRVPQNSSPQGGRHVLPFARLGKKTTTFLTLANAGTGDLGFRVLLYHPSGELAVETPPRRLTTNQSLPVDLSLFGPQAVARPWVGGMVAVDWVTAQRARLCSAAVEVPRKQADGAMVLKSKALPVGRTMQLHDLGMRPVTPSEVAAFLDSDSGGAQAK